MASLQRTLRGFSDFIGRYTGGQVNMQDSNVLIPTIEMDDFLNERKTLAFDTNFTAVNQVAGITVPDGKQWRVHFCSVYLSGAAGQQILYELHWRKVFGGATRYYSIDSPRLTAVLNQSYEGAQGVTNGHASYPPNLIIPAGDALGVSVAALVGPGNFATRFVCQVSEYAL